MGRIFEKRKHTMFARFDRMAKAFTKIGREIAIAVKAGGPDPDNNPRLRVAIQNAKGVNMPKDRVEAAIKRASSKDSANLSEVNYEAYGPHGIAIYIEAATDNPTRTVANVRMHITRSGGTLATSGALDFIFHRKGVFKFKADGRNLDDLELELIDFGAEDFAVDDENNVYVYTTFTDFSTMQKALEERKINVESAELQRIPTTQTELSEEQANEILELVAKLEEEDDVQSVYHNLK